MSNWRNLYNSSGDVPFGIYYIRGLRLYLNNDHIIGYIEPAQQIVVGHKFFELAEY